MRRLSEKFRAKKERLFLIFVDLEKAFDQVPRDVVSFVLCWKGVPEYLVNEVMSLYNGCRTVVLVDGELSRLFFGKVGVHQGSDLCPLSFMTVMDVPTEDLRNGSSMELMYADDLFL